MMDESVRNASRTVKRAIDVVAAGSALVILSPVLAVVALLIRVRMGVPVLFRQRRPGLNGQPFEMLKFRTMEDKVDDDGNLLPNHLRITPLGRTLRQLSLDEIPQLWNVVRGEMSLVGPRPLLMEYLERYSAEQMRRHDVRPGITGWAQVNGRNAISWEKKFDHDIWYVDNWSLALDMRILWLTAVKVVRRAGIVHSRTTTMPRFMGTEKNEESPPE